MRSMILALITVLLVAAAPAFAGGRSGQVEIGGYVGYLWPDDYGIFRPEHHVMYGARLGTWLSDQWGLELSGQTMKTETDFEILGVANQDFDLKSGRLNLLYNFGTSSSSFRPFLTGGADYDKLKVNTFGQSCDWGWNAGGGFRIFLSPNVNLRLEGRYTRTKVGDQVDESEGNAEAAVGLGFLFGGHHEREISEAPARSEAVPAEAVSCSAGDFPRNLSRLSNVDKACLDDVAQRLSADPRAHVVVIGYADAGETAASVDRKRAEAVRAYLAEERGIDRGRITVRGAGTNKPLGSDAAANRRVEIWFVPDGTKDPD